MSFVQDIANGVTGNLATDLSKWLARQTSNHKLIRAAEKFLNPDQLHRQTQDLLAESLAEGIQDLRDCDPAEWHPIFTHPENRLQPIDWVLGWHEDIEPSLGEWSLENAPHPEVLRGLLLRLHRLIQEKKQKYFSPEFFNLLSVLNELREESQETLESIEQQVGEVFQKLDQHLSAHTGREETLHVETQQTIIAEFKTLEAKLLPRIPPEDIETSPLIQEKISHARVDAARQLIQEGQIQSAQRMLQRLRGDFAKQPSSASLQFRIATNLGSCALHFEDMATAKAEFSLALTLQPDDPKALANAALAALLNDEVQAALSLSSQARQRNPSDPHITPVYLQALYQANQTEQLEQLLRDEPWILENTSCCQALGRIRYDDGKYDEAEVFLRAVLKEEPRNPQALMLLAQAIIIPLQHVHRDDPPLVWRMPAETRARLSEAESLLTRAVEVLEHHDHRKPLHTALANRAGTRLILGVFQVAQRVRDIRGPLPLITEIETLVLEYIGDLKQARDLRYQLSCIEPANIVHRMHLALLDFRRGERDAARHTITQIRFDEIKENARLLVQVAQLRAILEMDGVLPLAYQAWRLEVGNPRIHLAYCSMFLGREKCDTSQLHPEEIGIDCTVSLRRGNEIRRFTLLDETTIPRDQSELVPTDALAGKLMGRYKGDQVVLKSGLEDLSYEVIDVQSKYVTAFQETITGFTTRFPDHRALHRIEWQGNDPSKVLSVIDAHHERVTRVKELYTRQHWPLGAVASLAGCSLFDVWAGMVNQRDGQVVVCSGTVGERRKERSVLSYATDVVLDLTALLTLWHLGLHERIGRLFRKIFVAQAVLDEVNKELSWHYLGGKPSTVVGKEGDRYVHYEISPEMLGRQQSFLEGLRHFIESTTEVVPVPYALDIGKEAFESLQDLLGEGATASVLVAKGQGIPLYVDDLGLRKIAKNDWRIESIWSQTILAKMREKEIVTHHEYHEAVRRLVLANYTFVTLDVTDLLWLLQQNAMQITEEVTRIFARLQGPECDEESATDVLASVVRAVWLEALTDYQKASILDLILQTLTTGRVGRRVVAKLAGMLKRKLLLLPLHREGILEDINLWCQQKLL